MKLLNYFKIKSPFKLCIDMIFVVTFYQHEARQVPEQEGEGGDSSAFWRPELVLLLKKKDLEGCLGAPFLL